MRSLLAQVSNLTTLSKKNRLNLIMFRLKGVQKIYKFNATQVPQPNSTFVFFISSDLPLFKQVLEQIGTLHAVRNASSSNITHYTEASTDFKAYHIICCPNLLHCLTVQLEEDGLYGLVQLHRFNWDFIALDTNCLSLEIPLLFQQIFINQDTSLLSSVAHSLRIFNMVFGQPNLILTYGEHSENIFKLTEMMRTNDKPTEATEMASLSDFSAMLIVDRSKDYPSCLLTPVVYAGLLLEIFPAQSGSLQINVTENKINSNKLAFLQVQPDNNRKAAPAVSSFRLNGTSDSIYRQNRYRHFSEVAQLLSAQAKTLGMEGKNLKDMKLEEMQEYVATKLPLVATQKKELFKHLVMCETIVNELGAQFEDLQSLEETMLRGGSRKTALARIQEMLSIDAHRFNSLRHICLLYLTCGLPYDEATAYVTNYLNAFGYRHMPTFVQLTAAKLFPDLDGVIGGVAKTTIKRLSSISLPKFGQSQFQVDANKLKLLPSDQTNMEGATVSSAGAPKSNKACPSYVFSGSYVPLVAQLVNFLLSSQRTEEFTGKCGHIEQLRVSKLGDRRNISLLELAAAVKTGLVCELFPLKPRTVFVFIVGGATYAEVAACQLVASLTNATVVLASTSIISSSDIIGSAFS